MSENDDKLRELFKQLPTEEPSMAFDSKFMLKINELAEVKAKKKRRSKLLLVGASILGGLAGLFGLTWFLFSYYGIEIEGPQYSWSSIDIEIPKVEFPSMLVMLAIAVTFLLCIDMLIRRHRFNKRQKMKSV